MAGTQHHMMIHAGVSKLRNRNAPVTKTRSWPQSVIPARLLFDRDAPPPGVDKQKQQEELAQRAAQVDDLLEIVNTEGELRVNGSRSIGEDEFYAWIGRAT